MPRRYRHPHGYAARKRAGVKALIISAAVVAVLMIVMVVMRYQ